MRVSLLPISIGRLSYLTATSSSGQFEGALRNLLHAIGFNASRPDDVYATGPDVLALTLDEPALIIEAKSRRLAKNKLTKTQHGQVLSHENWYALHYGNGQPRQRVVVYPTTNSEDNAGTNGTLVLKFNVIDQIISDTRSIIKQVADVSVSERIKLAARLLDSLNLTAAGIINRLSKFSDAGG